jgi:hypothetical protein
LQWGGDSKGLITLFGAEDWRDSETIGRQLIEKALLVSHSAVPTWQLVILKVVPEINDQRLVR